MVSFTLFVCSIVATFIHLARHKEWYYPKSLETLIAYLLLFNMGFMGLLAAFAHVFMGPETAKMIGWASGSPFQYEIGMANLSYGVLGILCFWIRGRFWDASVIGWCVLLLGCFAGHVISYYIDQNSAPYNIGPPIWFYDLFLPLGILSLLFYLRTAKYMEE